MTSQTWPGCQDSFKMAASEAIFQDGFLWESGHFWGWKFGSPLGIWPSEYFPTNSKQYLTGWRLSYLSRLELIYIWTNAIKLKPMKYSFSRGWNPKVKAIQSGVRIELYNRFTMLRLLAQTTKKTTRCANSRTHDLWPSFKIADTLVPRAPDPPDLWQGSTALARIDFPSMRRVFVSYSQAIRFDRFDGKSVNSGLPVLDQARILDPCHRPEGSWAHVRLTCWKQSRA